MARIAELTVGFDADTRGLDSGVKNVNKTVKETGKQVSNSFGKSSTQAIGGTTSAVINFNRVIQDAPFGIIGVANNLDPLAQSFQNLRAQTGSARGALMTLLKSAFTGPGALITAVSLAGSGLLLLQRRMRGTGEAGEQAKAGVEAFTGAINDQVDALAELRFDDGLQGQLDTAKLNLQVTEDTIDELEKMAKVANETELKALLGSGNLSLALISKINDTFGTTINQTDRQKIINEALNAELENQAKLKGQILGLELALGSEIRSGLEAETLRAEQVKNTSTSILQGKQATIGLNTSLSTTAPVLGQIQGGLVNVGEGFDLTSYKASLLNSTIVEVNGMAEMFVNGFSAGLARLIALGGSFQDMLKQIGLTLLQSGLAKLLMGVLVGGTGGLAGIGAGLFGGPLLGGLFGSAPVAGGLGSMAFAPVQVTGQFKIQGSDLVTTINNTNSRTLR